jgi:CelD/BcsL family acetyltransferase involved in cellulose biosynthesis
MIKHPQRKLFVLFVNNSPIAYMAGLYDERQKAYYVPRLCINDEYGRYSPGIILVNETAKYLIDHGATLLDLMEGDEKYKLAMGGVVTNNHQIQISTNELFEYVHTTKH